MAYAMKKKSYSKGTQISKQGNRVEIVVMIMKGRIKIVQKLNKGSKKTATLSDETNPDEIVVEIAELGCNDMFGIVEVLGNLKKMKREATASSTVDAFETGSDASKYFN